MKDTRKIKVKVTRFKVGKGLRVRRGLRDRRKIKVTGFGIYRGLAVR